MGTDISTELAPHEYFRQDLMLHEKAISGALPAQVPSKKFISTAVTAVQLNPDILDCQKQSILNACLRAAADGLILDGKEAALVKFGTQATYMPMVAGIIKKVRNSGDLSTIAAHVIHENDHFDYCLGDAEHIDHKPCWPGDRGKPIGAYAIAKLKDGGIMRELMTLEDIEAVRNVSKAKNAGPWKTWWSEMARKTVIRRLSKRLPMSSDIEGVVTSVDEFYDHGQPEPTAKPRKQGMTRAEQRVAEQQGGESQASDAEYEEMAPVEETDNDPI